MGKKGGKLITSPLEKDERDAERKDGIDVR